MKNISKNNVETSFWQTAPGILTGIAGVITALTTLIVSVKEIDVFRKDKKNETAATEEIAPEVLEPSIKTNDEDEIDLRNIFEKDSEFQKVLAEYKSMPDYKALFIAVDSNANWVFGSFHGSNSQTDAETQALEYCQKYSAEYSVQGSCKIYARGDQTVWGSIDLSDISEFQEVLEEYQNLSGNKALFAAIDPDGRWASGFYYGSDPQENTETRALEFCQEHRVEYNVQSPCKIYARGGLIVWISTP